MVDPPAPIWRALLRREVVAISLFLFMADMIIGTVTSTLSLFAQSLGASLTLVGILATTLGLARFGSSIVIGNLSDRLGRRRIMRSGMAAMAVACLLYGLSNVPYVLVGVNLIFGMSFVACLTIGLAYAADVSSDAERSLVFGLATAAMGFGFAVGSLVGGQISAAAGYHTAYLVAMGMAVIGSGLAWRFIREPGRAAASGSQPVPLGRQVSILMANPIILAACVGSILSNLVFGGLILTFFPLHAYGLGFTQATIGSMLATRALASTLARLPAGILGSIFPGRVIMLVALSISTVVAFAIIQGSGFIWLLLLLIGEGIGYGLYMTSGQATIAKHAAPENRGAALGTYMASASVGDSFAPLFLGAIADRAGIPSVFYIVGGLALLGVLTLIRIALRRPVADGVNP